METRFFIFAPMIVNKRLSQQIQHAYENAPAFRARMDSAELTPTDLQTTADLEKLPVIPKDDVVQMQQENPPFGGLLAVPLEELSHIYFSPGPLYEPDAGSDGVDDEAVGHVFAEAGFVAGDIVLNTLSYHLVPAGMMLDRGLTAIGCTVIPGGVGNSDLQLKMMRDLGVTGYAGTPSFLAALIEKAEGMGLDFKRDFKVTKAFVSAEPLAASLRRKLVEEYGISVANGYGTAELGLLALDTKGNMQMKLMPEPIIEIVDSDTGKCVGAGEVGEVVVTTFNRAYPLIRFGTGDMAIKIDPAPGESEQAERAITLVGRKGEAVKVRGMFVHPNQLRFIAGQLLQTGAVQGIVTRPENRDILTVRVVSDKTEMAEAFKGALQQVIRVKVDAVEFVDALPDGAAGMVDERRWD